jgi:hypothetical protein
MKDATKTMAVLLAFLLPPIGLGAWLWLDGPARWVPTVGLVVYGLLTIATLVTNRNPDGSFGRFNIAFLLLTASLTVAALVGFPNLAAQREADRLSAREERVCKIAEGTNSLGKAAAFIARQDHLDNLDAEGKVFDIIASTCPDEHDNLVVTNSPEPSSAGSSTLGTPSPEPGDSGASEVAAAICIGVAQGLSRDEIIKIAIAATGVSASEASGAYDAALQNC